MGDSCTTNFWNDVWIKECGPLRKVFRGSDQLDNTLGVYDLVTANELWDWDNNGLLTNYERRQKHMTEDGSCPLCNGSLEMEVHAFYYFAFAKTVWLAVVPRQAQNIFFFLLTFKERLLWNLQETAWIKLNSDWAVPISGQNASIG
ncbi:hypothetical protein J1N35_038874 [Gossypium stocksii]|uniref:Reverse transcriptase zinc-binding domain-containing protein n=1 Tax=Gossypium stocksii TaxID=47602 RepID=A0A9D3UNA2_9ROSI|nr:hypothetical protein J1N35_038874 [Gossypium stocksii]